MEENIYSVCQLRKELREKLSLETKDQETRKLMKYQLGLCYRKIPKISPNANSDMNVVIRQQCALELIKLQKYRPRFISIDESFLGFSNHLRRKW